MTAPRCPSGPIPAWPTAGAAARTCSLAGPAHCSGYLLEDVRVRGEVDGIDVAGIGLDGVVIRGNLSDGTHQAAAHHHSCAAAHSAAVSTTLAVAARSRGRVLATVLAGRRCGTLCPGCDSECNGEKNCG